ncbi:hypothetical protein PUNSTDRAFT_139021 [Punctularia strigosozonata HHB-11173 SS5]|uniref:RNI-like protein n=1 Tax=Punctularia strigosozonata (strain HHB-11173) TaxID=741275 RepID=R7S419_PUNST|nr:uncharacterized protein PUNSTDRAFT_139021 [Punctularia strigosozonata HHB-11173 SS5]EIN03981.1 hypothetical protein PUNSTDRAFT_139021 [Punctularia strigosozonata HHB-11173 SS5]
MSEIHTLNLTPSLMDQSGLNLDALDLLRVFTKPNSFLFLAELDLGGSILRDSDITHIHHLPRVSTLMLNDTEISDEAVFHLVRLRRTLLNLDLAGNMRVTDDAAAPLLRLHRLRSLSLIETGVGMSGLRKFASSVRAEGREIDVEFPHGCEVYINRIQHHYLIDPAPPLIRDPGACASLSIGALRRNLAAHAECNPMILVGGTKEEMEYRLQDVLERRQADLKVREVMWREREETTADESDDYED